MSIILQQVQMNWQPLSDVLRVPNTEADYDKLVALLDDLIDEVGENEAHPLASFMDVVGVLVENYENEHLPELSNASSTIAGSR